MHIIVVGCGKVGARFAQVLSDKGHDVVIVDSNSEKFKLLDQHFNGITMPGMPIDQDVLKKAGIENADALAALTPDDNVNIVTCQIAKEIFKVPKVVARIYNPSKENAFFQFGLQTICQTKITAETIYTMLFEESNRCRHVIGNEVITFRYEKIPLEYEGKKIKSIINKRDETLFGIVKDGKFEFIDKNITLCKGDVLVIASKVS